MTKKIMKDNNKKKVIKIDTRLLKSASINTVHNKGDSKMSSVLSKGKKKKQKKKFEKKSVQKSESMQKSLKQTSVTDNFLKVTGDKLKKDKEKGQEGKSLTGQSENKLQTSKKEKQDSKNRVVSEKKRLKKLLWKQKQMAKKLERKGLTSKHLNKTLAKKILEAKVVLPKTAEEATANWKKLQETISSKDSKKRKIPTSKIRNPKLKKVEDWQEKNAAEKETSNDFPDIWFDDVDEMLLDRKPVTMETMADESGDEDGAKGDNPLVKPGAFKGVTKIVCMDCEMVGVGDGTDNMLARVSVVNQYGEPIYDKFVRPKEEVVDYRTYVSGVRPQDLENAEDFEQVQKDVADILKGKILVGHAIKNDLKVLYLSHPRKRIRDTSLYKPFRQLSGGRTPSLKKLSEKILGVKVQEGEHNSVQDAQATMRLYTMYRKQWENELKQKKRERKLKKDKT